eukprot:TRINITY_DN10200_c0_g1_i1.p1 TRINITY_DN10200_c0_g1~~TRINITY_DN10200_c0_g1_i1.p1  ORF type:complete len:144 (-),score=26.40 TRINITY_DN10200_c0_g1_i1:48-479(-)
MTLLAHFVYSLSSKGDATFDATSDLVVSKICALLERKSLAVATSANALADHVGAMTEIKDLEAVSMPLSKNWLDPLSEPAQLQRDMKKVQLAEYVEMKRQNDEESQVLAEREAKLEQERREEIDRDAKIVANKWSAAAERDLL